MATMGRPRKRYVRQVAIQILDRWATSQLTLEEVVEEIRKTNPLCPSLRIVYAWKRENKDFLQAYTYAREDRAEYLAELAWVEAGQPRIARFKKAKDGPKGRENEIREYDNVARSRLFAEMCMRRAEQLNPQYKRQFSSGRREDTGSEELEALVKVLQQGPAPPDPDDPSLNLGTTKPDFS